MPRTLLASLRSLCLGTAVAFATLAPLAGVVHAASEHPLKVEHRQSYTAFRAALKASMSASEWAAFKAEPLHTVSMRGRWNGEDKPGFEKDGRVRKAIDYLHQPAARAPFKLEIRDGKLFAQGKPFDTRGELVNAVASPELELYADTSRTHPNDLYLKHSSFLAGGDAGFAVEKEVRQGVVELMTNRSGHYRMSRREFAKALLRLEQAGLDMSKLYIKFDSKSE